MVNKFTCSALTIPSIISGSMRGSSPWILTTTSYFFSSFPSASLHLSVPVYYTDCYAQQLQYPVISYTQTLTKWPYHFYKILKSLSLLPQIHDNTLQSFHHPLPQLHKSWKRKGIKCKPTRNWNTHINHNAKRTFIKSDRWSTTKCSLWMTFSTFFMATSKISVHNPQAYPLRNYEEEEEEQGIRYQPTTF